MIRMHFFPKNYIRKRTNSCRKTIINEENQNIKEQGFTFVDIHNTQPLTETNRIKYSNNKPIHSELTSANSLILNPKPKKRRANFLLESRRKQICTSSKRQISLSNRLKNRRLSCVQNIAFNDMMKSVKTSYKRKERMPLTMRAKKLLVPDHSYIEMKVRGWQTKTDDFVDFS